MVLGCLFDAIYATLGAAAARSLVTRGVRVNALGAVSAIVDLALAAFITIGLALQVA